MINTQKRSYSYYIQPSGTSHLTIATSPSCSVISRHGPHLIAVIGLTKSVAALFSHALDLADLANRLLELLHARPVILSVVLLDLLNVMIWLRKVHALGILPCIIPQETKTRQNDGHEIEDW